MNSLIIKNIILFNFNDKKKKFPKEYIFYLIRFNNFSTSIFYNRFSSLFVNSKLIILSYNSFMTSSFVSFLFYKFLVFFNKIKINI